MTRLNRRNFCTLLTGGIIGATRLGKAGDTPPKTIAASEEPKIKKYNSLGATKLQVSDIIFGGGNIFSPDVVRYAFDLGVNTFDTAEHYMNGRSEEVIGEGLKGVRNKAIIIGKLPFWNKQELTKKAIMERAEKGLKKLQSTYVDVLFIHMMDDMSLLKNEEVMSAYQQLIKDGKARYTGFSTHNAKGTLAECVKPEFREFSQAVLFMYNHMEGKELEPLIKGARDKGVGTIVMKSLAGGKHGNLKSFITPETSYPQAAISWVMGNPAIDCSVLTMGSFSHVEEYVRASGKKLERKDLALLQQYQRLVDKSYCRLTCNQCEAFCPNRVPIHDIMRYAMYYEDYHHESKALEYYQLLTPQQKPLNCASCTGHCTAHCPHGLPVQERLQHIHRLLSV